ncbi:MAG: hypothetical protein SFV52_06455 [Saprospiraceae bacterium]|nr:hypothetical protein [Saprospiraceae bacterium]
MYKSLFNQLRTTGDGWCVSIVLPTEKGFQDHKMTDATLKGAFREAEMALEEKGLDKRAVKDLMDRLHALAEGVDFAHGEEGLGFFVGGQVAKKVDFPFPVHRKVIVDTSFEVRDLVYGMGSLDEYFFLTLSRNDSRLYYGLGRKLWDVTKHHEGLEDLAVEADWSFDKMHGDHDAFQTYLQHVDKNLGQYLNRRKLPVIVGGNEESLNFFFNHTHHGEHLKGRLNGSFDQVQETRLAEALEPILHDIRVARAENVKDQLAEAEGRHKASHGIVNVWPLAREGRVDQLVVERGYRCPAYVHNHELFLEEPDSEVVVQVEDAVDDLIEIVLGHQGSVFFVPAGTFEPKVAALLRY